MIRTTAELVEGICEVDEDISLTPFIAVASALVDVVAERDTDDILSDAQLTLIETWLAAHFYCIRVPRTTSERAGSVSESFESKVDLGLDLTRYGQQARILDLTGELAKLSNSKSYTLSVNWLGTSEGASCG